MSFIGIGIGVTAASALATAALSAEAASRQASAAAKIANYNAEVDINQAKLTGEVAQANIQKQRLEDASYLSSMRAAYAASGISSGGGSPMAVLATTAGRQEQDIQNYWTQTQNKETQDYESAQIGIYQGEQEADTYHLEGAADIFKGIGSASSILVGGLRPSGGAPSPDGASGAANSGFTDNTGLAPGD